MPQPALFAGVDRAAFASAFGDRLRRSGVDVSYAGAERFASGLDAVGPLTLADLYWLSRISFVTGRAQLPTFDVVFRAVFGVESGQFPTKRWVSPRSSPSSTAAHLTALRRTGTSGDAEPARLPWATLPSVATAEGSGDGSEEELDDAVLHELLPSSLDIDIDRPFDTLDDRELALVGALIEDAATRWPHRRTRRQRASHSQGTVALRRSVRRSMRTGGDVVELVRTRQRRQPRPVVIIVDVSGSMESHARAYLHLARALAVGRRAEVFAFATRLTRITPSIRLRSPTDAIDHVTDDVGDRFAGTRLASSMRALLHHRVWGATVRGAVVVICSDGWDTDEPEQLERTMRRVSLIAHRVVWINPRAAADEFEPLTGGMAAALPYCDHLLAGNTARSMQQVIEAISEGGRP